MRECPSIVWTTWLTSLIAVRDTFKAWVAEFVPTCVGEYAGSQVSKDSLRHEIFEQFPQTKADYDGAFLKLKKRQQRELIRRHISDAVLAGKHTLIWRNIAARGLRHIIFNSDYCLGFAPTRQLQQDDGLYDEEEVELFVTEAWEAVGDAAWQRHCEFKGTHDAWDANLAQDSESEPESEDDDVVRFPPQPEGYRQTWWDSDANDI